MVKDLTFTEMQFIVPEKNAIYKQTEGVNSHNSRKYFWPLVVVSLFHYLTSNSILYLGTNLVFIKSMAISKNLLAKLGL